MVDFGSSTSRRDPEAGGHKARSRRSKQEEPATDTNSVISFWGQGSRREALALLYRHACRYAVERGARLHHGDSEGAVSRAVFQMRSEGKIDAREASLLADTVRIWSRAAWADVWPDTDSVNDLCDRWHKTKPDEAPA